MVKRADSATDKHGLGERAAALLKSLKGVADARVDVSAAGSIVRVHLVPAGIDDRQVMRNAQSALMAVLGQNVDVNAMVVSVSLPPAADADATPAAAGESAQVFELKPPARRNDLNEAAKVAFETLRAAQADFHGFQFDGAELVRIGGYQYVVVAVKRAASEARFCGAAPVLESVPVASARALMNAVGVAALHGGLREVHRDGERYGTLNA